MAEVIAQRFRAASPGLAWVLGGAVVVLAAAAVVLSALAGQLSINITAGVVIVLTLAGVGLIIASRQPGNPIGWLMVVFTLVYVLAASPVTTRCCITTSATTGFRWLRWPRC